MVLAGFVDPNARHLAAKKAAVTPGVRRDSDNPAVMQLGAPAPDASRAQNKGRKGFADTAGRRSSRANAVALGRQPLWSIGDIVEVLETFENRRAAT